MIAPIVATAIDSPGLWEDELVRRLRDLDPAAWTELFDQHHDKIWRYAFAKTGKRDIADDVASQVFVEGMESIHRFQYRGKPVLAWLYRIARNHLGKRFRAQKRERDHPAPEFASDPLDPALDSIVLSEALGAISRQQADAVVLRFFSGYSTAEIAHALGKSKSAVYSLQTRALASLRQYLGEQR
jgi:RNA polymerase sigma-70 factor (ECF subfamily)